MALYFYIQKIKKHISAGPSVSYKIHLTNIMPGYMGNL